jgi:hypothetical protein
MQATGLVKDSLNVCAWRAGVRKLAAIRRSQNAQGNKGGLFRVPAGRYRKASCSKLARCASQARCILRTEASLRLSSRFSATRCWSWAHSSAASASSVLPSQTGSSPGICKPQEWSRPGRTGQVLSLKGSAVQAHQLQVVRNVEALLKGTALEPVEAVVPRALHL